VPKAADRPPAPKLFLGSLPEYVASAGLRWMVLGSPRQIAQNPAFQDALSVLFPAERLEAYAQGTGVDLRQIESGLIAGFDLGTLYALTPPKGAAPKLLLHFRERLVSGERVQQPHPDIERVYGIIGATPELLVRIDDHVVAIAVGDPTPARVVEAFALGRLKKSPTALRGAALSLLSPRPADAVATFYAPGPFSGEWAQGARGLLANVLCLSVSLSPLDAGHAKLHIELVGDFPASGADELAQAFRDLAESQLGKLLALDQTLATPEVHEREQRLLLDVDLDLAPIARGLRAAVMSDVWEIMNIPAKK
jgi:hypothetical protein